MKRATTVLLFSSPVVGRASLRASRRSPSRPRRLGRHITSRELVKPFHPKGRTCARLTTTRALSATPVASASSPTRAAVPRARSSTPLLEGLRNVATGAPSLPTPHRRRSRGAAALPRALLPGPWCGLAMVFLRDEAARGRSRTPAAPRASVSAAGGAVPVGPEALGDAARRTAPPHRATRPAAPARSDDDEAEQRAYRARKRLAERPRAPTSFALVPHRDVQGALCGRPARRVLPRPARRRARRPVRDLPPALLDEHEPSWERAQPFRHALPQRRDQRDRRQRRLDARARGPPGCGTRLRHALDERLRLRDARQRARAAGARRTRHPARARDARPGGVGGRPRARTRTSRVLPLPRRLVRAMGRPRRRSSSPTGASSAPRSTATACGRCATRSPTATRRLRVRGRRLRRCRRARACGAGGSGPARCSSSTRGLRARGDASDQAAARAAGAVRALAGGRWRPGHGRRARPPPDGADRAPGAGRVHAGGAVRHPAAVGRQRPRADLVDGRRHGAAAAGRPRAPALQLLPAAVRPGHEPRDRPPARAARSMSLAHAARRARAAARRGARGAAGCSSSTASSSSPRRSTSSPRAAGRDASTRPRVSRAACARLADEAEAARRRGRRDAPAHRRRQAGPAARAGAARRRRVHHRLVRAGLPDARDARRRERRAARECTTSPACSATARRRSARGSRSRRWLRWPRPTGSAAIARRPRRRSCASGGPSRTACSRSCRRWASRTWRATAARSCSTPSGSRGSSSRRHSRGRRRRSAASAWRSSSGGRGPGRRPPPSAPRLENPGYVKYRKGGEPHATTPEVVEALQGSGRTRRLPRAAARRATGAWEGYTRFAELVNGREPIELARPAGAPARRAARAARGGRACGGDRAALLERRHVARCPVGRGPRDDRDRVQPPRRPLELRRGRRGSRRASGPTATPASSRSRRAASESRRSTRPSPRSCRSRSRRARSPARAASCRRTRSPRRSPACATRSRAWR